MDALAQFLGLEWKARSMALAMRVHLPHGQTVDRWADRRRWLERHEAFGREAEPFWVWQEQTADTLWRLMTEQNPLWPPQSARDLAVLARQGLEWLRSSPRPAPVSSLVQDALRPLDHRLKAAPDGLRTFIDGQLLISAQAISSEANALYGAAALDLPRQGVVHFDGGMGTLADQLAGAVEFYGGQVLYRHRAARIVLEAGRPRAVETAKGELVPADLVIANLPEDNLADLLPLAARRNLSPDKALNSPGWGAFVAYLGLDGTAIPERFPLHHQILQRYPLAEGNSIFMSVSAASDLDRAPLGQRAVTLSTHTQIGPWWRLLADDPEAYEERKSQYLERLISGVERIVPAVREAIQVKLPGTPATFQRYTGRKHGWVGGFPQTGLFKARGPKVRKDIWMVGDSIFPGQSTTAVALGGLRVAGQILADLGLAASSQWMPGSEASDSMATAPLGIQADRKHRSTGSGD